jgi:hypothetical protein
MAASYSSTKMNRLVRGRSFVLIGSSGLCRKNGFHLVYAEKMDFLLCCWYICGSRVSTMFGRYRIIQFIVFGFHVSR